MRIYYAIPKILQTFSWFLVRPTLFLFTDLKIVGKDNLNLVDTDCAIFASNHTSEMDPIITTTAIGPFSKFLPMFFVSRESNFYTGSGWRNNIYGGRLFALFGAYPVYSGEKDYKISLATHIKILLDKRSIYIFPEGTRFKNKEVTDKAHGGVAFLSSNTGLPIVPIAIKGASDTTLFSFFLRRKKYSVSFGKPIYPKDIFDDTASSDKLSREDYKNGAKIVMRHISQLYDKL